MLICGISIDILCCPVVCPAIGLPSHRHLVRQPPTCVSYGSGLPIAFMSGFCVAASRLGAPDAGLLSYGEVLDQGRSIVEATRALPVIGDADTG